MKQKALFIRNEWRITPGSETIKVIDPSSGEMFAELTKGKEADIDEAVKAARASFESGWGILSPLERGRMLSRLGELILESKDELARIESKDVGKPLKQALNDVLACARYCEFYAGAVDKLHGETIPYQNGYTVFTIREPHGITAHIIPWNYPLQIIGRSVIGSLAAGNTIVIKPGEDASLSTLFLGELIRKADFPAGTVNIVTGLGDEAGAALAGHPGIDHLSFTGSTQVGTLVQKAAAENTIPVTLELGGKSPQLIFEDANLEEALPFVVNAAVQNAGQTCSAGSRVILHRAVYNEFCRKLADRFEKLRVGPALENHDVGPLISEKQKLRVNAFLKEAEGLILLAEGKMATSAPKNGFYILPRVYGDVPPDHRLAQEEVFGPVLAVIPFEGEKEAVEIANNTPYGLVAGVWTRDGGRQLRMARALKSGQVFVNNYGAGGGVELPFGGVKGSGFGREKGMEALYGFTTLKTVAIKHD